MNCFRLFVAGVVLGGLVSPSSALAGGWKRQSTAICWGNNNTYSDVSGMTITWPNYEFCPYDDDSNIPRTGLTTLNVHGKASVANAIKVSACVKVWNSAGFFCGLATGNTTSGVFTIAPDRFEWNNVARVGDFSYLKIEPNNVSGGEIWGIFTGF